MSEQSSEGVQAGLRVRALIVATSLAVATLAIPAFASGRVDLGGLQSAEKHDRFIIKYKDGSAARTDNATLQSTLRAAAASVGIIDLRHVRRTASGAEVIRTDDKLDRTQAEALMRQLASDPGVDYVEVDTRMHPTVTPNDTYYDLQWGYSGTHGIRADQAWDVANGSGIVVAVLDTGITSHGDLDANVMPGYDFISDPEPANDGDGRDNDASDPGDWVVAGQCGGPHPAQDSSWHGTHVAGTVAAVTDNGRGVAGVAHGARIVPVRVLGTCGGYASDIADGIVWAAGGDVPGVPSNPHPAEVLNLSLGGFGTCGPTTQGAIDAAVGRGAIVVVAAGNDDSEVAGYTPASCGNVITVGATTEPGLRAGFSNHGALVDVAAPGSPILSTVNAGVTTPDVEAYAHQSGTSMAAPHVAGVVALVQSVSHVPKSPSEIEVLLKSTASAFPSAPDAPIGTGIVDARAAIDAARPTVSESRPFVSRNVADDVPHGTVYYLVPGGQPGVSGPTKRVWYGTSGFSQIVVTAQEDSGTSATIKLRGQRSSGCNGLKRMEDGAICYAKRQGPLTVSFHAADNPGLAPGRYRATFDVEAIGWHTPYRQRFPIAVDIRN